MSKDLIEIDNIIVGYGSLRVLNNFSMSIKEGDIVAIVGPNGAGKSTLLNTITGLLYTHAGSIRFEGKDITFLKPHERINLGISLVPEGRKVFPEMTVLQNLKVAAFSSRTRDRWRELLKDVYEIFPRLKERENQVAKTLSGGEQQMLSIGRALMQDPKIILCDEVSFGLAPIIAHTIYEKLIEINKRGVTILLAEQSHRKVAKIVSHLYVIHGGKIILSGDPKKLKEDVILKAYFGLLD